MNQANHIRLISLSHTQTHSLSLYLPFPLSLSLSLSHLKAWDRLESKIDGIHQTVLETSIDLHLSYPLTFFLFLCDFIDLIPIGLWNAYFQPSLFPRPSNSKLDMKYKILYAPSWRIAGMNAKRGFVADLLTQKEVPEKKKKGRCNRVSKLKPSSARLIATRTHRLRVREKMYLLLKTG